MKLKSLFKKNSYKQAPPLVSQFELLSDGKFDYSKYREAQTRKASTDQFDTWADEETLRVIADYVLDRNIQADFVICHGSKSGMEAHVLGDYLDCDAVGSDIAPPPHAENVVEWDFHEANQNWLGRATVVYTNALDHAYDPKKAIDTWVDQLAPGGLLFIEHTMLHSSEGAGESDPFGAHPMVMPYLVLEWGEGRYCIVDMIRPPFKKPHWKPSDDGTRPDTDLDIWVFVISRLG